MADPLSPLSPSNINRDVPASIDRVKPYPSPTKRAAADMDENQPLDSSPAGPPSSPFIANLSPPAHTTQSPSKAKALSKEAQHSKPRQLTEQALRENEDVTGTHSMDSFSARIESQQREDDAVSTAGGAPGFPGMDDTCFSAFSAVPNADMTSFANLGQSPSKSAYRSPNKYHDEGVTPRPKSRSTPSRNRDYCDDSPSSPTPRRHKSNRGDDTTNLLVDFTDQFSLLPSSNRSPGKYTRPSPKKHYSHADLASYTASRRAPSPNKYPLPPGTPSEAHQLANLLDFDLPPLPTPRSIPSISARELESMKSAFQSQISSLTATLKGKDAEVGSLKGAVEDAERRVGEAQERYRDEKAAKEGLQSEKDSWEKRQQEMQSVLKDVKEEIIRGDREREALLQQVQSAEHRREEAEAKAIGAESKLARTDAVSPSIDPELRSPNRSNTNAEVEAAVTKVAKELHGLYKSKHETKVTALKKSYADRWEKKVRELQAKVEELSRENDELRMGRDATMSGVVPGMLAPSLDNPSPIDQKTTIAEKEKENLAHLERIEFQHQQLLVLESELSSLHTSLTSAHSNNESLKSDLDSCRAELTGLVDASEELMQISQAALLTPSNPPSAASDSPPARNLFNRSLSGSSGSSGLKAPRFGAGYAESRIGKVGGGGGGYGYERSGSGAGASGGGSSGLRSGIMSNIERMGRVRGAAGPGAAAAGGRDETF